MEIRDIITGAGALFSIAMAVLGVMRAKSSAETAVAVKWAVQEERMTSMTKRIGELEAELNGVRSGLESGLSRVHDSLGDVVQTLQELKTTVAVLVDRDERPARRAPATGRTGRVKQGA